MRASASALSRAGLATFACAALTIATGYPGQTQVESFTPVTDAELQNPDPADWLMWRRTLNSWGYSPLDQIDRENVGELRMVWSRALAPGSQQGTPLVYDGIMYMPNPNDVIQAIDAATGDLHWEYRRQIPDDVGEYLGGLVSVNRNVAIYGNFIIDTSNDDYLFALDATSGQLVWETQILDCTKNPARHGKRRFLTARRIPPGIRPVRSSPTARSSRGVAVGHCAGPTHVSSPPTMPEPERNCGAGA